MDTGDKSLTFQAGGFTWNPNEGSSGSASDGLGRLWNNLSGTTARNEYNHIEAELAYERNSVEAQKNRDWETEMSNTAYQRAVADMKAAGLNPASLGGDGTASPAATPAGYAATAPSATSSSGGSGGLFGLVTGVAKAALGMALFKKYSHSATAAVSAGKATKAVSNDIKQTVDVLGQQNNALSDLSKFMERKHREDFLRNHPRNAWLDQMAQKYGV